MSAFRTEKDPLGEKQVPADALYGIQTLPAFVDAMVWIKRSAALTHRETGRLDARLADAIVRRSR